MSRPPGPGIGGRLQALDRAVGRRRGLLAAGLTAGAVATALPHLAPAPPEGVVVLAAGRDLDAGTPLTDDDVVRLSLPLAARPEGVLTSLPAGARVAGRVRRGEALTDARLLGAGLLGGATGDAGLVATPVRLADPAEAALLHAGDRIDVLAAAADGRQESAPLAAADVLVLAVPVPDEHLEAGLVVLATTPSAAARLAAAAVSSRLSVVVRAA